MRKMLTVVLSVLLAGTFVAGASLADDTLAKVKAKGVLVAGVKDSLPPFGFIDKDSRTIVGYDIDFVNEIAKQLGVKVELKPVTSASRMPQLIEGNIDIIAATMTKNPERAKQIDFSYTYFLTGQSFLVKKGTANSLKELNGKKIGTAKGSTSEQNAKKALPNSTILSFDDYPQAVLALQQGKVAESILAGQLAKLPKGEYEIPKFRISEEPYGLGVRKGDMVFLAFVNKTLLEMEKSGQAKAIFEKWFGPDSGTPLERDFTIYADERGLK
jgi:polar amino acid transport system substrate-binding protein